MRLKGKPPGPAETDTEDDDGLIADLKRDWQRQRYGTSARVIEPDPVEEERPAGLDNPPTRTKRRRLNEPFTLTLLPDAEQQRQLTRWLPIACDLRRAGIRYKEDYDEDKWGVSNLLTGSQLQALLPEWKKERPEIAELPAEAAQQILDDCVSDLCRFRKGKGSNRRLLREPVGSLRLLYVRFVRAEAEWNDYGHINGAENLDTMVNTKTLRLPKLGIVKFNANNKYLLRWIRTANIQVKGALIWLHDDGEWRIRVKYKVKSAIMLKPEREGPDPDTILRLVRQAVYNTNNITSDYIGSAVLREELARAGIKLSATELSKAMKAVDVTLDRKWVNGAHVSCYSVEQIIDAMIRSYHDV